MLASLPPGAQAVLILATAGASAGAGQALCKGSGQGPALPALGARLGEARRLGAKPCARAELGRHAPQGPGARGPRKARRHPELKALGAGHPEGGQSQGLSTQRLGALAL